MKLQPAITIEEAARSFERMLDEYDELEREAQGRPDVLLMIAQGRADIGRKIENLTAYVRSLSN